jgi:signal transduction histidine kinase
LDTKLKNYDGNRAAGIFVSALVILSVSVAMIFSYQPMLKLSQRLSEKLEHQRANQIELYKEHYKTEYLNLLARGNYALYWDMSLEKGSLQQIPAYVFLEEELSNLYEEDARYAEKEAFLNDFNNIMNDWYSEFFSNTVTSYPQLEYFILDHSSGDYRTNSIRSVDLLIDAAEKGKTLQGQYPFYIIFRYESNGSMQIMDFNGYTREQIDQLSAMCKNKEFVKNALYDSYMYQYANQVIKPSDVTIIYTSEAESFFYPGGEFPMSADHPMSDFSAGGYGYLVCMAALVIVMLALLLPFIKPLGIGTGLAAKVPFEFALVGIAFVVAMYHDLLTMAWQTVTGFLLTQPSESVLNETALHILDYCFNLIVLAGIGSVLYLSVLVFRRLLVIGPKRYIKEQTVVGRITCALLRMMKRIFFSLREVDLMDRSNKLIIRILVINFVILALFCSIWVLGIAVLIPYTILLFFLLRRYVNDIKKKYAVLLEAASKMAEGNLEVDIQEDLGIFEPLKEEFAKVQHGFKYAVEEEMKSQRMKTDLITNVSHDLKTPLTAIITYINLLKDANITEEERSSYINTLDMKSQRLKRLIEDLFEVSKASSNNITLNYMEVDLVDLMKQVLLEMDDKLKQGEIELRVQMPEEKVMLTLDSEKTYRIFENLIMNIIKYAMPRSRAYITLEASNDQVNVVLKNVSAQELNFDTQEITDRFVRGDQSRNTEGSGLGLAIVKSFVELQGGKFGIVVDGDLFKAVITWKR